MRQNKYILMLPIFFSALVSHAQKIDGMDVVGAIEAGQTALGARPSGECGYPDSPNCTFQSYCFQLGERAGEPYLYEGSDGRKIPNYAWIEAQRLAAECENRSMSDVIKDDPFLSFAWEDSSSKKGGWYKGVLKKLRGQQSKSERDLFEKEYKNAGDIFYDAKEKVKAVLLNKRTASNSEQIDNMIRRIDLVKFKKPNLDGGYEELVRAGCELPNAYFKPDKNEVLLCPQFLKLPKASLFSILSHELSHAIDPCTTAVGMARDGGKFPKWMNDYFGMENGQEALVSSAIPISKNPFQKVLSCLKSSRSMAVKVNSLDYLVKQEEENLAWIEVVKGNYNEFKYCGEIGESTQMVESFSDWLSTQALLEKMSEFPGGSGAREYALSSQAALYGLECPNVNESIINRMRERAGSKCESLQSHLSRINTFVGEKREAWQHLGASRRVNAIYLAHPSVRKTLGCKGAGEYENCNF